MPRALNESLLSRAAIETSGVAEDALHRFTPLYVTPRGRYTKKRIIPFVRARRESFHLEARQVLVSRRVAPLFRTTCASSPRDTRGRCSSPAVGDTVDPPPGATHGASHMALFLRAPLYSIFAYFYIRLADEIR